MIVAFFASCYNSFHTQLLLSKNKYLGSTVTPGYNVIDKSSHIYSETNADIVSGEKKTTEEYDISQQIDLLYDSECPICMMEVNFLEKRDINHKIRFTDLSSPDYNPAEHGNVKFADGMRKIRAVLPDGQVVVGVEVFRRTYEAIGLGWVFQLTKLPVIGEFADRVYDLWAENRLRITGRKELAEVLKERSEILRQMEVNLFFLLM